MRQYALDQPPTIGQRARRRVALKTSGLFHTLVHVLVNAGYTSPRRSGPTAWDGAHATPGCRFWGRGLELAIRGIVVLVKLQGKGLEQRWIERETEALRRRAGERRP